MNEDKHGSLSNDLLPQANKKLCYMTALRNVHYTISSLTRHMMDMVRLHRLEQVEKCMEVAGQLYATGNEAEKNVVENIFVYSFTMLQLSCSKAEWSVIRRHIPSPLYAAYVHQVSDHGC